MPPPRWLVATVVALALIICVCGEQVAVAEFAPGSLLLVDSPVKATSENTLLAASCSGDLSWTGTACGCKGGATQVGTTCTCPGGGNYAGDKCHCPGQKSWTGSKCDCMDGATVSGNQCQCTGGRNYENEQCKCPGQRYWTGTTCGCKDGATPSGQDHCTCAGGGNYDDEQCKCPGQLYWTGSKCDCKDGATPSGNQCTCTGGRNYANEQCKCPGQRYWTGTTCGCKDGATPSGQDQCTCAGGGSYVSEKCQCPGQLYWTGTTCGCKGGATPSGQDQCTCAGGGSYVSEECQCPGQLYWTGTTCGCKDGATAVGDQCTCPGGGSYVSEKCQCPGQLTWTGSTCACQNGNTPTANYLCTIVCGLGTHLHENQCVNDNCQGETVWISDTVGCGCINGNTPTANHKCSCKNGAVLNGNQCTCAGGNYHENDETCHCDGQLYWTGSACDCKDGATPSGNQCQCTGGRNYANEQCKCQGQQYWTGTTCGCKDGATASGNQCTCTGGRNYENEQCVCPSGKMYDGTNCVASCYWKPNNQGSVCSWSDFTKTSLKLKDDCNIDSPVSKDNYVADKRNNKYDLAPDSQGHFRAPSADPSITISATKRSSSDQPVSSTSSWLSYVSRPSDLENDVRLPSLGVHDLSIVAKDYRGEAKCFGCVAVQDAFPPTPKSSCGLPDPDYTTQPSVVDYSSTSLQTVLSDETTFNGFFADSNVDNNGQAIPGGDNERCDDKHLISTDFFQTTATSATDFSTCFTNDFVDVMLTSATPTKSSSALSQMVVSGDTTTLQCKRCCSKKVTLQEYYFAYSCSTDTPDRNTQGTASCTYNRCLQIQPPALITATSDIDDDAAGLTTTTIAGLPAGTVGTTGPNYIHRSVTCKAWSEACHVQTTLGGLLTKDANWNTATGFTTSKSASDYVAWVYKIGDDANSAWVAWNDGDSLTFTNEATNVHVEAWTPCGRVLDKTYTFKIHLHSTRDVCKDFALRWTSTPTTRQYPAGDSSTICAYPGSDFALLTFTYNSGDNVPHESGRVKGKYTNIQCDLTVQEHGSTTSVQALDMTSVFGLPSPKPDPFTIAKQFAVELVKDPTTAIDTTVSVNCKFTFQYFDGTAQTTTDDCPASFTFTDCDLPTLETYSSDVACLPDQCGSPTGLPGAFETCDGTVFTTATVGSALQTAIKSTTGGCCTQCSSVLSCVAPEAGVTVKRCEPPLATNLLMALAMDESEVATVVAEEQQQSSTSTMTMLLGASAIVAVVALVVVKTRAAKAKAQTMDDAYMSLLD